MSTSNGNGRNATSGIAWEEPLIFERSRPGRRGSALPELDVPEADPGEALEGVPLRGAPPLLPVVS